MFVPCIEWMLKTNLATIEVWIASRCVCVCVHIYICYLIFSTGPHLNLSSYPNLSDHGSVWHGLIYWCSLVTRIKSQCINELCILILYLSCTYILHIIGEKLPSFLYWLSMSRRLCVVPSYKLCNTMSLQKMCSWFVLLKSLMVL